MDMYLLLAILIVIGYLMNLAAIVTADYDYVKSFMKHDAPAEIYACKKEFKIKSKVFDYVALTLFLAIMPLNYIKIRK